MAGGLFRRMMKALGGKGSKKVDQTRNPVNEGAAVAGPIERHQSRQGAQPTHFSNGIAYNELLEKAAECCSRYDDHGLREDIDQAISHFQNAIVLCSPGSDYEEVTARLGVATLLKLRYEKWGDIRDIEGAIGHFRSAFGRELPEGHPGMFMSFNDLSNCLYILYENKGDIVILEDAIKFQRILLQICPARNPVRLESAHNLASYLRTRYRVQGDAEDLEEAIVFLKAVLILRPVGNPQRPSSLHNLGICFRIRHEDRGNPKDLEEAAQCFREGLSLLPAGHEERSGALGGLANVLVKRYEEQRDIQDLEEAIRCHTDALTVLPSYSPIRSQHLHNLATCLNCRYENLRDIQDLEDAIKCHRIVLSLHPPGHTFRTVTLNGLAGCLRARYEQQGDIHDIDEALQYFKEGLEHCPEGHSARPRLLLNFSHLLREKYKISGNADDLVQASVYLSDNLILLPHFHPSLTTVYSELASMCADHPQVLGPFYSPEQITQFFNVATISPVSSFKDRFQASLRWVQRARGADCLQAYQRCLELADSFLLIRSSISSRRQLLSSVPHWLAPDAAAIAVGAGDLKKAVEFLEQGRALLWSQMSRYRASLSALQDVHPGLAATFQVLSQKMETSAISRFDNEIDRPSLESEGRQYRAVAQAWDEVIKEIRKLQGFDNFLKPATFSTLNQASQNGPVIIINVSKHRSDAIIVHFGGDPILVPLPNVELVAIYQLYTRFTQAVRSDKPRKIVLETLRSLWDDIVEPVVQKLSEIGIAHGSRIWWCPTSWLAMLPLHAAGHHRKGKPNLPDLYVSSYTPTLSGLIRSSQVGAARGPSPSSNLLVVAQPDAPDQLPIPGVWAELQAIRKVLPSVDILLGDRGTYDAVLNALRLYGWVHFSCHGSQDVEDPFDSCFHLYDKALTLLDIIQARLPDAQYAFLSACHSAAGDKNKPDETIHLAAALQFSGFRSVIGTMYAMADVDGPVLAEEVYKYMSRGVGNDNTSGLVDCRDAATALNIATKVLRDTGVPVERWINFVHIGA